MDRSRETAPSRRDLSPSPESNSRELIVRAAQDLIRKNGFPGLTVEEVRKEAGVSRATFYFYFRNMKHLLMGTVSHIVEAMYDVAGRHYPDQDEFTRIVRANIAYLNVWRRETQILGEFFILSMNDDEAREVYLQNRRLFEERISSRIQRLSEQGRIPSADAPMLAAALGSMVEFCAFRYFFVKGDSISDNRSFPDLVKVVSESWYRAIYGRVAPENFDYALAVQEGND